MTRRLRKVAGRIAAGVALLGVFAGTSATALVFHLDLPAGRRYAAHTVAGVLNDLFKGSFEISGLSQLSERRLGASRVTVRDPEGRVVLVVKGLRAEFDGLEIVKTLMSSSQSVTLIVPHIRVERAEAFIEPHEGSGVLGIARAFELEPKAKTGKRSSRTSQVVRVWLPSIELGSGFARGRVGDMPTLEAELSGAHGQVLIAPQGVSVDVPRFATAWRGLAGADVRGVGSFHLRGDSHFWSSFDGNFGELQLNAVVRLDDGKLDIRADVPQAKPDAVRALWADWPVQAVADARVEASGPPENLATKAWLTVGKAEVEASGVTRLAGDVGVNLDIRGQHVDLRAIWPKAPASDVEAFTTLSLWNSPKGVVAEVNGSTEPTELAGIEIPALDVTGTVEEGVFEARATAHEPGLPLRIDFTVRPAAVIEIEVRARRFRLEKSPRVQKLVAARGGADATIKGRFEREKVEATVSADVTDFRALGLALDRGKIEARLRGRVDRPRELMLDARVNGSAFEAINRRWGNVKAQAKGPLLTPEISATLTESDGPDVEAKAKVSFVGAPRVTSLNLGLKEQGNEVKASAGKVAISKDRIEIEDLSVIGAGGDLAGSVLITPRLVTVEARGQNVDLDVLAAMFGLPRGKLGGKLTIDADATVAEDVQRGRVRLELERGSIEGISGLNVELEASLDEAEVEGSARAEVAGLARGATEFDLELAGRASDPESWRRATGRVEFRLDELELSNLVYLLPREWRIEDIDGKLTGQVIATREHPDELPSLSVLAGTQGLRVERAPAKKGEAPLVVEGIELQLGSRIEGPSGDVDATLRLVDGEGALASASARTNLPLAKLWDQPQTIASELAQATLLGKVVVEQRSLETLPPLIRPKTMNGVLRAEATLGGSFEKPLVTTKASLEGLVVGTSTEALPVDVCAQLDYSHENAEFTLNGETFLHDRRRPCQGRRVGQLRSFGQLNIGGPATPGGPPRIFQGEALLLLEGLPLEMIAPLGSSGVRGEAHGRVVLQQDSDGTPNLNARVNLKEVRVETIAIGDGQLNVRSDGEMLRVVGIFDKGDKSRLQTELSASLAWDGLEPSLDRGQPLLLEGLARRVDAAMVLPALHDVFSELSGPLDGHVRLELSPDLSAKEDRWQGELEGELVMTGGSMQFAGLGMRLSDVRFSAKTSQRAGRTVIDVESFSAASRAKKPNVFASAQVYFEKLDLVRARANVKLRDVPILIQGVAQANANTGESYAFVDLVPEEERMAVTITIPSLTAELPPSSGRDVLSLDANRSITVIQPLTEPRKKKSGGAGKPWQLVFVLRNDVKVVRSDLRVPITGRVEVDLADETEISGTVQLKPGGRVTFAGKTFVIEEGEVLFDTDDPGDPHLRVRASWRAPEGTTVYLNLRGTFSKAEPSWESDPQLPEQQIYALLLGGSTGEQSGTTSAAATGVGVTAGFLGQVLSDTPLSRVELRTGSEQTLDERTYQTYTAALRLTDEVSVEGSFKSADANEPGDENEAGSLSVDWRFRKNWSLRTELGTIGAGMDLLWTHHY